MFLKEIFQRLLFKQSCELCHKKVTPYRFFCGECQTLFSLLLSSQKVYQIKEDQIFLFLGQIPHIQVIKKKLQNPRNFFLVDSLVMLIILAFHALNLPWPKSIKRTNWLPDVKTNFYFLKKLSKSMGCSIEKERQKSVDLIFDI